MKYSEAQAELDDLIDSITGSVEGPDYLIDNAMMIAMARCQVKRSRRPHAEKLLREFWREVTGSPQDVAP